MRSSQAVWLCVLTALMAMLPLFTSMTQVNAQQANCIKTTCSSVGTVANCKSNQNVETLMCKLTNTGSTCAMQDWNRVVCEGSNTKTGAFCTFFTYMCYPGGE
jgi:hypothetical protein